MQKKSAEYQPLEGAVAEEAETEPGSGRRVLRNKRGMKHKQEMEPAEYGMVRTGYLMRYEPLTGFFVEALARRGRGSG